MPRKPYSETAEFWTNNGFMAPVVKLATVNCNVIRRISSDQTDLILATIPFYLTYTGASQSAGLWTWTGSGFTYDMSGAALVFVPSMGLWFANWGTERIRPFGSPLYRRMYLLPI